MKSVLYAVGVIFIASSAASATPIGERASVKPSPRGDVERSAEGLDRSPMPVGLERLMGFDSGQPSMTPRRGGTSGWTGNDNEG